MTLTPMSLCLMPRRLRTAMTMMMTLDPSQPKKVNLHHPQLAPRPSQFENLSQNQVSQSSPLHLQLLPHQAPQSTHQRDQSAPSANQPTKASASRSSLRRTRTVIPGYLIFEIKKEIGLARRSMTQEHCISLPEHGKLSVPSRSNIGKLNRICGIRSCSFRRANSLNYMRMMRLLEINNSI